MGRFARRTERRKPLRETLAEIRREKAAGKKRPRKLTRWGKIGGSEYVKNDRGHRVERPTIQGLNWLRLFAEALKLHGVAWDVRVSTERWEHDACVSLHLQRVVHDESAPKSITVGKMVVTSPPEVLGGGAWEHWRIPIGLLNDHDVKALYRLINLPKAADLVLVKAIHGH